MKKNLLLILLLSSVKITHACDCDSIIGKKDAKSIFKGTVYSINRIDSEFVRYEVMFKVKQKIKGKIKGKKITVNVSCLLDMCCGIPFKEGDSYIIYTFIRNNMIYTSACTETKKLRDG
ncbi:MAG TPA: hypothetical protein VF476_06580 [Chitinophagaceae bacterium]